MNIKLSQDVGLKDLTQTFAYCTSA